jgi:N-methylhydantoinase A
MLRLGLDVGGTFTDLVCIDGEGHISIAKTPSVPKSIATGVLQGLHKLGVDLSALDFFSHGTTVATNAVIERTGARAALLTTEGFRDVLEIQRGNRRDSYDLRAYKPPALIPRDMRFEVPERLDWLGEVIRPLDREALMATLSEVKDANPEAIAVVLLHSYANPDHERQVAELIEAVFPQGIHVSLSSDIIPEHREFERSSTTVINAYLGPIIDRYLGELEASLVDEGFGRTLMIMQSNGGLTPASVARREAARTLLSGPAAGVIATAYVARTAGLENAISMDMGGTSCDVGLVHQGLPNITTETELEFSMPLRLPTIDVHTIGAGGGSIAWVDKGGILRVGPQSAGADPGPACYGRGGHQPTVTDAHLALGRLASDVPLGGEVHLDSDRALKALQELGLVLDMNPIDVAKGIDQIVNAHMIEAIKLISVRRGYDLRDFALVAFGGAGPLHAGILARELSIPSVIVPRSPGLFSAFGLLAADVQHDYMRGLISPTDDIDWDEAERIYKEMEERGRAQLTSDGIESAQWDFRRLMDLRYAGQNYEITVEVASSPLSPQIMTQAVERFCSEHERLRGHRFEDAPTQVTSLRVSARGRVPKPTLTPLSENERVGPPAPRTKRPVHFKDLKEALETAVYQRQTLLPADILEGPAIVEEMDSTTVIYPGQEGEMDPYGNIIIRERGA